MFSLKSTDAVQREQAESLSRVVQQLLEAYALHAVEYDAEEHTAFRASIRELAVRFDNVSDHRDLLVLAGETNKTIQTYNKLVEKFIRDLSAEKQLAVEVVTESLLKICHSSDQSAQNLRQIAKDLAKTYQLQDMRELRAKLSECARTLCLEAEVQESQSRELKERTSAANTPDTRDQVTGLHTLKDAELQIKEVSLAGRQGYVIAFFLKNVDVVNRRFGFSAGDDVLKRFAVYLGGSLRTKEQLFRWRGPCFVLVADRIASLDEIKSDAYRLGVRGPEVEVENGGKSMLIRLTAATAAFPIPKGPDRVLTELSASIDQFASEQFKLSLPHK